MAKAGDEIVNPRTGQHMVFLEAAAESVRIDTFNPPTGIPEPVHVHPFQQSSAEVISGSLRFRVNGKEHSIGPGGVHNHPGQYAPPLLKRWGGGSTRRTGVPPSPEDGSILRGFLRSQPGRQAKREGVAATVAASGDGAPF